MVNRAWRRLGLVFLGLGILFSGIGISFWAGTETAFSQQAGQYRASFSLSDIPKEGRVGLRLVLPRVEVKNTGGLGWPKGGSNQVRLAYRWFYGYGAPVPKTGRDAWDDLRADLPQDITPNVIVIFPQFVVGVPSFPGDYVLHLNMSLGDRFFADFASPDYEIKVSIKAKDTTPPTASVTALPLYTTATSFQINWSGSDEADGTGLANYDVQYRNAAENDWHDWLVSTTLTGTQFSGENGKLYLFRARATDRAGNTGNFPTNEQAFTRIDALPPVSRVNKLPSLSPATFLVRWSSFDNVDQAGPELYDLQYREGTSGPWNDWITATASQSAVFSGDPGKSYSFRVRSIDYAGNQEEYTAEAQASTAVSGALGSFFGLPLPLAPLVAGTQSPVQAPTGPVQALFPLFVKNGEGGTGTSGIVIRNPGTAPINVFVRLNDRAGAPFTRTVNGKDEAVTPDTATGLARVDTILQTVAPGASATIWSGNISATVLNGWVSVNSDSPFEATSVRLPAGGTGQALEYGAAAASRNLYLPFLHRNEGASSTINLVNPGTTPADFTISYNDASGAPVFSETLKLGRLASTRIPLSSLGLADLNLRFSGSAVISSNVPLAASVETPLDDGTASTYSAVASAGEVSPLLPAYKEVDGITTSLLVQNAGTAPVSVKVEYLDLQGQVLSNTVRQIPANGRATFWQGDAPETKAGFTGRARVSTSGGSLAVISLGSGAALKGKALN